MIIFLLIFLSIIVIGCTITQKKSNQTVNEKVKDNQKYEYENFDLDEIKRLIGDDEPQIKPEERTEYTGKYQKKYLLTKNEWYEYRKLRQLAESKGLQICPKVRLLDLIEPRRGDPKYKTLFYKIQAKHVDFVICDQNLYVKAILELDDNSHNQTNRKERDEFVDLILKDVGYTVIRTRSITDTTLDILENKNPDL